MRYVRIYLYFFLPLALAAGCVNPLVTPGGNAGTISLLHDKEDQGTGGDAALLEGTLTLVEGCFLITSQDSTSFSPVWPYGFSYQQNVNGDVDSVEIYNRTDRVVARVGERISVGGSEFSELGYANADATVSGNLNCPKPFWNVAGISPRS